MDRFVSGIEKDLFTFAVKVFGLDVELGKLFDKERTFGSLKDVCHVNTSLDLLPSHFNIGIAGIFGELGQSGIKFGFCFADQSGKFLVTVNEGAAVDTVSLTDGQVSGGADTFGRDRLEVLFRFKTASAAQTGGDMGTTVVKLDEAGSGVFIHFGAVGVGKAHIVEAQLGQITVELIFGVDITLLLAPGDFEKRGLGDVDVTCLNKGLHVAEEEGEQQCTDVRTVHISIGHDHDTVVTGLGDIEVLADTAPHSVDERLDLFVIQHTVKTDLFNVDDLTADGEDRLIFTVPPFLGGTAC